jgi:hypothetical protein
MKRILAAALGVVLVLSAEKSAVGQEDLEQVVCQDYGGWPDVGGTRVCVTSSGSVCRFRSETWGVSGGCS